MFSLQQIFGKGDKFFDLLEASAEEGRASAQALVSVLKMTSKPGTLDDFVLSRRKDKKITEEINQQLVDTFVTGLDREDIEALSNALYKIPKTVEKFAERYLVSAHALADVDFTRHAEMVEKATDTLVAMVKQLRTTPPLEKMKELNERLQYVEGEADKMMVALLKDLYSGKHEAIKTIMVKDLYELLEKIIDRCRDAGNVVSHIVMKNS
jgi:uncharacterized protein Yka (UPF0111/DUF47 family)